MLLKFQEDHIVTEGDEVGSYMDPKEGAEMIEEEVVDFTLVPDVTASVLLNLVQPSQPYPLKE
jgi:hypothetical protein